MKITLAITTMDRVDLTLESFSKVYDHPMIDEIVIVEDHGDLFTFTQLFNHVSGLKKVKLFRNEINLGMSRNKAEAISKAKNEWVVILDSDNILYPEYIDSIPERLRSDTIMCPVFAEPDFNFKDFSGKIIDKKNAKDFLHVKEFRIFLNTCNYLVNRDEYLKVYRYNPEIKESDTIHFNFLWLQAGNSFYFMPDARYYHRKHPDSGWLKGDHAYNMKKANEIQELIKQM